MSRPWLVLSGAVLSACVLFWAALGDQTPFVRTHLVLYAIAFGAYLLALGASRGLSGRGLALALALSAAWRVGLAFTPPLLSDDVFRSVWEGRVQLRGGNPYAWMDRPGAERWVDARDGVWVRLNHKQYTAIYPPLWQLAARGVVTVHDSVTAMKLFLVGCELLVLALLAALLRRRGQPRERLLVLAWSPLSLVEVAGSGHNEAFALVFLCLSLLALEARRPLLAAVAGALGAQAKVVPGLLLAAWARRFRARDALVALVISAALVAPFASAGRGLWRSLGKFGQFWRFNETGFAVLAAVTPSHEQAVVGAVVLLALAALAIAWRIQDPVAAALAVLTAWLLLSPNVLPWYALWLLPLLVLRDAPALLLFTATVQLAYLVYPIWYTGERWRIGWDVRALEYLPCLAVLAWARRREAPALHWPAWRRTSSSSS